MPPDLKPAHQTVDVPAIYVRNSKDTARCDNLTTMSSNVVLADCNMERTWKKNSTQHSGEDLTLDSFLDNANPKHRAHNMDAY